jgi:hypothetical protein
MELSEDEPFFGQSMLVAFCVPIVRPVAAVNCSKTALTARSPS